MQDYQTPQQPATHAGIVDTGDRSASPDAPPTRATHAVRLPRTPYLRYVGKLLWAISGLFTFMVALGLLKEGASLYGALLLTLLNFSSAANALGLGWLLAYVFLSGSPVAALAVTLFASGSINGLQAFLMISGSRLGASFIVLFVGFLYYLRGKRHPASIATGILALLTTAVIYLPALLPGYWLLRSGWLGQVSVHTAAPLESSMAAFIDPVLAAITSWLPGWSLLLGGVAALLLAFSLFDRALPNLDGEHSPFGRIGQLVYRPSAMFVLGASMTALTMSVSVSLALLVPLSVKGLVRRENIVPYILGANITTFIDTLVAALLVGGQAAFSIVLAAMISVTLLSLLVLFGGYRLFERSVLRAQDLIMRNRITMGLFLGTMLLVPILLLII